jgi:hypothetical protein
MACGWREQGGARELDPYYCTSRINWVPRSRRTFPVLELNTDTGPDASSESPLIPNTPLLVESSEPRGELAGPRLLVESGSGMAVGDFGVTGGVVAGTRDGASVPPRGIPGIE